MARKKKTKVVKEIIDPKKLLTAISWCFRNDIRAYPVPSGGLYQIIIESGLEVIKSPKRYNDSEWHEKIWEIYWFYYNQSN